MLITRNLPPLVGGMERLVWHLVDELQLNYRVHVVGPSGCGPLLPPGTTFNEVRLRPLSNYLFHTLLVVMRRSLLQRPHLVVAGSGLTSPFAWMAARISRACCVVYLHGLDVEAAHPLYRLLWRPFIRRFDCIVVNSHFTRQLALHIGIPRHRIKVLHPGVSLPDLDDAKYRRLEFRKRYDLGDSPLLLYVGRLTARKGFAVFCAEILPSIIERQPDARVVVIGDEPASALLQEKGERARIEALLALNGLEQRVLFLGELSRKDPQLSAAYFAADVLVFPVQQRQNDNEGFGMVAIEAAAHNLPTVAFSVGGVTDAIADNVSGRLISPGDNQAFAQAVIDLLRLSSSNHKLDCRSFAARFAWPLFGQQLRDLCKIQ